MSEELAKIKPINPFDTPDGSQPRGGEHLLIDTINELIVRENLRNGFSTVIVQPRNKVTE